MFANNTHKCHIKDQKMLALLDGTKRVTGWVGMVTFAEIRAWMGGKRITGVVAITGVHTTECFKASFMMVTNDRS